MVLATRSLATERARHRALMWFLGGRVALALVALAQWAGAGIGTVIVQGNALDGTPMATLGIVSAKGRAAAETGFLYVDAIQTDAEINPGNSGGPLFDIEGRFLGIHGLMASRQGRSNSGVGFASPVDQVRLFMKTLLKEDATGYGFHGIEVDSTPDESGARVTRVLADSRAAVAEIRPQDVITEVKGETLRNRTDFVNDMGRLQSHPHLAEASMRGVDLGRWKFVTRESTALNAYPG